MTNDTNDTVQVGRLAVRVEGDRWVAYYALPDTMEAPIFLGSIAIGAVTANEECKAAFIMLMRAVVEDFLREMMGARPTWGALQPPAPEHERAGNA
jgi:hypothetical protein